MHLLLSLVVLAAAADAGVAAPPPRPVTFDDDARQPLDIKDTVVSIYALCSQPLTAFLAEPRVGVVRRLTRAADGTLR